LAQSCLEPLPNSTRIYCVWLFLRQNGAGFSV
jgi:hypothetical protein